MKSLRLAFGFLTILPLRYDGETKPGDFGRSAAYYPFTGLLIGILVIGAKWAFEWLFPPMLAAVLATAVWVIISGGLHLDGLADCFDGITASVTKERRLEIMKDPRMGAFGGIGLTLYLILKVTAVASLWNGAAGFLPTPADGLAILLATTLSRWVILPAGLRPMARPGGLGAEFATGLSGKRIIFSAILPLTLLILAGWWGPVAAAAAVLTTWVLAAVAKRRLGGMTGDVLGLIIEMVELAILLVFSLQAGG